MKATFITKLRIGTVALGVIAAASTTSLAAADEATGRKDPVETTTVFQNGEVYASAKDSCEDASLKASVNLKDGFCVGRHIRFAELGDWIRGENVEILEAKLQLYYYDEWWTKMTYHVSVSRSLDGSIASVAREPESTFKILGDKWPAGEKTRRPSWIDFPLKPETVKAWISDESKNKGLVIHVPKVTRGNDGKVVDMKLADGGKGALGPVFRSCASKKDSPRLVLRYRITGNAAPTSPVVSGIPPMWGVYSEADLALKPSEDPNGDAFSYELETARGATLEKLTWRKAAAEVKGNHIHWRFGSDWDATGKVPLGKPDGGLWIRVRAVDERGGSSRWETAGPYGKSDKPWTVWSTHGNRKIWPDLKPTGPHGAPVKIQSARNEWEPFQVVVMSHAGLSDVRVEAGKLSDGRGHTVPAPTAYRAHYLPIADTANKRYGHVGLVPDALVPLIHPQTGKPTGGKYGGAVFNIPAGKMEALWFDTFVAPDVPAGIYKGAVKVTADGIAPVSIPVELEVFDFELPSPKHLTGFFQMGRPSVIFSHRYLNRTKNLPDPEKAQEDLVKTYEEMLHEHYINNWSPLTGWNYGLNGLKVVVNDGKVTLDWTEFDKRVGPYMDGSGFRDKVPAQSLFVPYWLPVMKKDGSGLASRVNMHNYMNIQTDLFGQYIKQVQQHLEEKGWLDRAYVFYFDEPFLQAWKYGAFIETAKIIRKEAPKLKIMITDGYKGEDAYKKLEHIKEPITKYVDVWDPVTFQVRAHTVEFYRNRKKEGKFDMWCQTLGNANANVPLPNLYPEYDMPFHRTWGHMSWNFGFQGIEWWATIIWWNSKTRTRLDPWTDPMAFPPFNKPLNCDGRLFYPGTPDAIGGPDIPISCLRMKALREGIEDYEYFYLLDKLGHTEQEFDINSLHTVIQEKAKGMTQPMELGRNPAWQWWEGDPDAMLKAREKVARLIEAKRGNKGR